MQLAGKVALVTGAGAGIGRASAEAFAAVGASVVVVDLDEAAAIVTAQRIRAAAGTAVAVQADVSLAADIRRMFDEATRVFGGVDIVHNNAGLISGEPLWPDGSLERVAAVITVNLGGVAMGTQQGIIELRKRGGGAIINSASVAALGPLPSDPVYSATKAGVVRIVESCVGFAAEGIRVNAVLPGMVDTDMTMKHTGDGTRPAAWLEPVLASTRLLSAAEIAAVVLELVCDDTAVGECRVIRNRYANDPA
ncbi:MAG: SDR family NAD(P)-dependent oxidoreductase [Actinobacteria bacterium]|nr:SDR family NAD(P)-dependent oxidoreductase [Actinomycetota bacterium]